MEDLNKSQLILLGILVSFVTSITTSVLTVSMLDEQAPTVTQTITRVVERTIETVASGEGKTVIKEVPVIVTEEELIVKVVDKAAAAVGVLTYNSSEDESLGLAFVLDGGAYAVTAAEFLPGENQKRSGPYNIALEGDVKAVTELAAISADGKIAILKIIRLENKEDGSKNILSGLLTAAPTAVGVKLSTSEPSVGQTVIGLGSVTPDGSPVAVGIVSSLVKAGNSTSTAAIKTNAANNDNLGGPLFSIQGEVVALNVTPGTAVPARLIKILIDSIK